MLMWWLQMFESTGWDLVEPSNEDTNKYDNLCPTIVTWKPLKTSKQVDSEEMADVFIEDTKVMKHYWLQTAWI